MPANEADCLANYELGEQLAPGVHKAVCKRGRIRGRAVALRMTPAGGAELAALEAACALHRTLHHPAVVTLFSAFYDAAQNVFCEVLEFCPGGSLAAAVDGARGREKEVLRAVVEALLYLEKERVEHRAVGPGSVLLAEDGRVKLGNFRRARKVDDGPLARWSQDSYDLADLIEWLLRVRGGGGAQVMTLESRNLVVQLREKGGQNAGQIPLGDVLSHAFLMTATPRADRKVSSARTVSFAPFVDISGATGRSTSSQTPLLQDISNLQPIPRRSTLKTASAKTLLAIITDESKTEEPVRYPLSPPMTDQSTPPTPILPEAEGLRDIDQDPKPNRTTTQHPEALTTNPLEPQVFKLGHGSLAIQQSRALLVDLREGARRKGKKGDEVLLIDRDGHTVHIYGAPHLSVPCVLSEPRAVYALGTLPEQHWQAYRFAAAFLDAVKRRKPRALFLVEDAQCALMSNGPPGDVEVKFFRERQRLDKHAQRAAASTRLRVLVSRAKQTVEIASFNEGAMSVKKTCAFRPNSRYGLGRDDERELGEEETAGMLLSMKCVSLCAAFEGLGFDSTGGAVDGGESEVAYEEQDGPAEGISTSESRSLSVRVEPRPRWSPAMLA